MIILRDMSCDCHVDKSKSFIAVCSFVMKGGQVSTRR